MNERQSAEPDNTAIRTALWRALHVEMDAAPPVFVDTIGLQLAAPDPHWRERPDMSPFTKPFRASIIARARYVEDLVAHRVRHGLTQYVILGAGLDTFAQRRADLTSTLQVFEIDQPATQAWKRQRLIEQGYGIPSFLHLVPVNFEAGEHWPAHLAAAGFDLRQPAAVSANGVSMYLTRSAILTMLQQVAAFARGSTLVMSFMVPLDMVEPGIRIGVERAMEGARASGTPFVSFFTPDEMVELAREAGFKTAEHVSSAALAERYFANRNDDLRPPDPAEELLVATT